MLEVNYFNCLSIYIYITHTHRAKLLKLFVWKLKVPFPATQYIIKARKAALHFRTWSTRPWSRLCMHRGREPQSFLLFFQPKRADPLNTVTHTHLLNELCVSLGTWLAGHYVHIYLMTELPVLLGNLFIVSLCVCVDLFLGPCTCWTRALPLSYATGKREPSFSGLILLILSFTLQESSSVSFNWSKPASPESIIFFKKISIHFS